MRNFNSLLIFALILALATATALHYVYLDITVVTMLYLLIVLAAAYFTNLVIALLSALTAFFLINYFFIEPKFTFQIGSGQSWVILIAFLILSLVVSSSIKQLKSQKQQAETSRDQAKFSQVLAELLAEAHHSQEVLQKGCEFIQHKLGHPVAVVAVDEHKSCSILYQSPNSLNPLPQSAEYTIPLTGPAIRWAIDSARIIGPGTPDWPNFSQWIIPFGRYQSPACVLVVDQASQNVTEDTALFISLIANQFSTAYYRSLSVEKAMQAELLAKEESFQKTLLTSLSHDMRTPLTAILGSVSALIDSEAKLDSTQQHQLLASIQHEAYYLTQTSENVLSLVKLSAGSMQPLTLDWQLPEEIIEAVLSRYHSRNIATRLSADIQVTGMLIKADALLMAQALANLIDNALKYHRGEQPIQVCLELLDGHIEIAVKNQGEGFPPDFTVEKIRQFANHGGHSRGYGLGLAIVKEIVQAHGARLEITSSRDANMSDAQNVTTKVAIIFPVVDVSF